MAELKKNRTHAAELKKKNRFFGFLSLTGLRTFYVTPDTQKRLAEQPSWNHSNIFNKYHRFGFFFSPRLAFLLHKKIDFFGFYDLQSFYYSKHLKYHLQSFDHFNAIKYVKNGTLLPRDSRSITKNDSKKRKITKNRSKKPDIVT